MHLQGRDWPDISFKTTAVTYRGYKDAKILRRPRKIESFVRDLHYAYSLDNICLMVQWSYESAFRWVPFIAPQRASPVPEKGPPFERNL